VNRFLTLPADERRRWCEEGGARLGLDAASIEKDFWVCWALGELFTLPDFGEHLTFKGGTSLSKCWKLIERFSEDVDVVVDREYLGFVGEHTPEKAKSNRERERRLEAVLAACRELVTGRLRRALEERCRTQLPATADWELSDDSDDVDGQTLLLRYPTTFPPGGYLRRVVSIELGARSDTEPSLRPTIRPYLAEALPEELPVSEIALRTVAPERTFWEKAMLLHEETYCAGPDGPKPRLSRHYYDLWCLIRAGVAERAAADDGLFERVAEHRRLFFRKKREAQETLRPGLLRLIPREDQLPHWRRDYDAMREAMFFGEPPAFQEILRAVGEFQARFNER
jgi:hypothetical protein